MKIEMVQGLPFLMVSSCCSLFCAEGVDRQALYRFWRCAHVPMSNIRLCQDELCFKPEHRQGVVADIPESFRVYCLLTLPIKERFF